MAFSLQDPWTHVAEVVRLVRTGQAQTRPELADATNLGRKVITQRVQAAQELGLLRPSGDARSRGGRAAEVWEFDGSGGAVLVAFQGVDHFRVAVADLALNVIEQRPIDWAITADPAPTCERMAVELEALVADHGLAPWGLGVGLLGPVDYATGRMIDPFTVAPVSAGTRWPLDFDVRGWFAARLGLPVWIEAVSNLMALGAAAALGAPADLVAVRLNRGIGCGIVSDGRVHRGADGLAGELTHMVVRPDPERICPCGRTGCLGTFAGGWALETDARKAVAEGRSPWLAGVAEITAQAVVDGAQASDPACLDIVRRAAEALGFTLAGVTTWFNPRRLVIGGAPLAASPFFQQAVRRALEAQTLSASLEHLEVLTGDPDRSEEVMGAAALVVDALLSPEYLTQWGPLGSPTAAPALATRPTQV
jgi:predicted NBD/HSP70 family sugar kinase